MHTGIRETFRGRAFEALLSLEAPPGWGIASGILSLVPPYGGTENRSGCSYSEFLKHIKGGSRRAVFD